MDGELKEKIYVYNKETPPEEVEKALVSFIENIYNRRRQEIYADCYKAVVVNMPDRCAIKVCENDGLSSHHHSEINLVRYLKGDHNFLSTLDLNEPFSYMLETKQISREVVTIGIMSGAKELFLEVKVPKEYNEFQLNNLMHIVRLFKKLRDTNAYSRMELTVAIPGMSKLSYYDFTNKEYDDLESNINKLYDTAVSENVNNY